MTRADDVVSRHPFVVAHRGSSATLPEHTLAAYDLALKEGADGVECDVRLTRDGHLVCVHDRRLDRTSTGAGLVSGMTLAELRKLEYGAWHGSWRADGAHGDTGLLTLDALVSLVLDWQRPVKIFIETKHPVRYGSGGRCCSAWRSSGSCGWAAGSPWARPARRCCRPSRSCSPRGSRRCTAGCPSSSGRWPSRRGCCC